MIPADSRPSTTDDLETLAAYVEGRLGAADRERVEERLARDAAFAEILAEALLVWDDEDDQVEEAPAGSRTESSAGSSTRPAPLPRPDTRVESRRRRRAWRPLALAASLVLAVGLALMFRAPAGPGTDWTAGLVDPSLTADPRWTTSGVSGERGPDEDVSAFELGVLWAELRLAASIARVHDDASVRDASNRARLRFEGAAGDSAVANVSRYLDLAWRKDPTTAVESTETVLLDALSALGPDVQSAFAAGRWAESGRLAAVAADEKRLRRIWRQRRVFEAFASRHGGLDETLAELESSFAGDLDPAVIEGIEERFRELIRRSTAG